MRFHADLHIHSKYSRATSRDLDLEHLAWWGARKGIGVVATGDCVHPEWLAELKAKLVPAEPGLFRLRPDIEAAVLETLPPTCRAPVRFLLSTEISTIYKKGERTRKVHHLIYAPDFNTVDRLAARLAAIGNIASDGRPILGLDSRDLLEIALESGPGAFFVPAHIWTPWFAAMGSQSGFDSIEDCYRDLAGEIFAVETGLSSDPAMNWRLSSLDRFRLTSNSDAHSPGKLGREATLFDCATDYFAIRDALKTGAGYVGTVEFFPEEGKYHADGHRKCGVRLSPKETLAHGGRCPVCGGPLTIGVLHRIETLADRSEEEAAPPPTAGLVQSLVPLPEILGEILGVGPASKRVAAQYDTALAKLGPELSILETLPLDDIAAGSPLLAEAVARLRAGRVIRNSGYDGEYGIIRLFEDGEIGTLNGGLLFDAPVSRKPPPPLRGRAGEGGEPNTPPLDETHLSGAAGQITDSASSRDDPHPIPPPQGGRESLGAAPARPPSPLWGGDGGGAFSADSAPAVEARPSILAALDPDQRAAASLSEGPLLVIAGPGSGKTRMLTHRIAHLVAERGVPAESCLAITFTRRAAEEMRERLGRLLPADAAKVPVHTFHSLGLSILRESPASAGLAPGFRIAAEAERAAALAETLGVSGTKAARLLARISRAKSRAPLADAALAEASAAYAGMLATRHWLDFDDLVGCAADALARDPDLAGRMRERIRFVSVDEFQDVDEAEYGLLRLIVPPGGNLCAIGDPDQAIYGFRGADGSCFRRFAADDPAAITVELKRNYRSSGTIVAAASQVIAGARHEPPLAETVRAMQERIAIHAAPSARAEAEYVVATIERLMGGHSFFSIDSGRTAHGAARDLGFADFAVLYRTEAQSAALVEALARSGMPFKTSGHAALMDHAAVRALLAATEAAPVDMPLVTALHEAAGHLRTGLSNSAERLVPPPSQMGEGDHAKRGGGGDRTARSTWPPPPPPSAVPLPRDAGEEQHSEAPSVVAGGSRLAALAPHHEGSGEAATHDHPHVFDHAALADAERWLSKLAADAGGDRGRFREAVALASETDFFDPRADRIALLTMHAAKGLEFPVVFVVGLEDGIVPLRFGALDAEGEVEERRLFYVAMTRAEDMLFLSRAAERLWRGRTRKLEASPFLADIEAELLRHQRADLPRRRPELAQLSLF